MRVWLRDSKTGLYFKEPREWTAERDEALSFRHSAEAMDRARMHGVADAEVVLHFEETSQSVAIPLPS